jgi:hypothetical protein
MKENNCPICKRISDIIPFPQADGMTIDCPACGKFHISGSALMCLNNRIFDDSDKVAFAHWIYKNTPEKKKEPLIRTDNLKYILDNLNLPSVDEQFVNLINYLGANTKYPAKPVMIYNDKFPAIVGSVGPEGANYINNYLMEEHLIEHPGGNTILTSFILTPKGWERYGEIKKGIFNTKEVFMAMKYDDHQLNQAYVHFKKAVETTGFKLQILDEILKAGLIDDQLRVSIRQSKFMLVDLTHGNAGAYWEAGFAEGLGKQVIYLCEKAHWEENKTHFDTNHLTTVPWSLLTIEEDMKRLKATIRATFPAEATVEDA